MLHDWKLFSFSQDNLTEHVQSECKHSSLFLIGGIQGVTTLPGLPNVFLAVLVANVGGSDSLPVCRCATFHPYNGLALNVVQRFTICRR